MKSKKHLSLYQKFVIWLVCFGMLPLGILCLVMINTMFGEYRVSIQSNYNQAAANVNTRVDMVVKTLDDITKMIYSYDAGAWEQSTFTYGNYDNVKQILREEGNNNQDMQTFLQTIQSAHGSIVAVHFIADDGVNEKKNFHSNTSSNYFESEDLFEKSVDYQNLDRISRKAILIPTHENNYFHGEHKKVFTIARNYFDLSDQYTTGVYQYIGTLFLDIDVELLENICRQSDIPENNSIYMLNEDGNCLYSTDTQSVGKTISVEENDSEQESDKIVIQSSLNNYGLHTDMVIEKDTVFSHLESMQRLIFLIMTVSIIVLGWGATLFTRRLTRPMENMMKNMAEIEKGNFSVQLPVNSTDEIGILSRRFNEMSEQLENYINQVYLAQVKQTEAEMTALRAQIYPHFLYNTLEIIRMSSRDEKVSRMIEALSAQIHYIIGTVQDMVPLGKEIEIVEKYIYLLNCRIDEKISFTSNIGKERNVMVPKLIIQPIVENAYIHGLKPRGEGGQITIDAEEKDGKRIISVMDNGIGMSAEEIDKINQLLEGNEIGIKNEHNWQSVGLKNVHDRIRYLYGKEYGLSISSFAMVGTIVSIILPIDEKEM